MIKLIDWLTNKKGTIWQANAVQLPWSWLESECELCLGHFHWRLFVVSVYSWTFDIWNSFTLFHCSSFGNDHFRAWWNEAQCRRKVCHTEHNKVSMWLDKVRVGAQMGQPQADRLRTTLCVKVSHSAHHCSPMSVRVDSFSSVLWLTLDDSVNSTVHAHHYPNM